MRVVLAALLVASATLTPAPVAAAATCTSHVGPGLAPPASVPAGIPGFHASWYGGSGYMWLCPGDTTQVVAAFYNSGSAGWLRGRMGMAPYIGTWRVEPGQDQPSVLGGDGTYGSPATGWDRFNRPATATTEWVGPGQIGWFVFTVKAPAVPGTYRLGIRPLIEGSTWMEDYGVFWALTVLEPDGSLPPATPPPPAGFWVWPGAGLLARDINDLYEGVEWTSSYLATAVGGDRRAPASARIFVGDGSERFCCVTYGATFDIVTGNSAWASPPAAAPDTWSADTERAELAGHEYVHVWEYELGGSACMLGPRWISEGIAESLAYRSLVAAGRIPAANMDVFTKRQLRNARYVTLRSLEYTWPSDANPFAVAYLAVDRLLAEPSPLALRTFCRRVGTGEAWWNSFAAAFGTSVDAFYARFEEYRAQYLATP